MSKNLLWAGLLPMIGMMPFALLQHSFQRWASRLLSHDFLWTMVNFKDVSLFLPWIDIALRCFLTIALTMFQSLNAWYLQEEMWKRKKNIIVSDHQMFWVSHSPALPDKCNRTSCDRWAVSLTSPFFPYNINSEVGKKVAVESCLGAPLCLDSLPHQEKEVSHLRGYYLHWCWDVHVHCVCSWPAAGNSKAKPPWVSLEKLMLFSSAFCLVEEFLHWSSSGKDLEGAILCHQSFLSPQD